MSKVRTLLTLLESIVEDTPLRVSVPDTLIKKWNKKRKGRQKFGDPSGGKPDISHPREYE